MMAFPQNGWDTERENWTSFLDKFEAELFEPLFKQRGYTKNAALQAYFINVATTVMFETRCTCEVDEEENSNADGEEWKGT